MTVLDDLVPVPLHRFTQETLAELRAAGKCEGLHFEFKSEWKPEDVTRCVCAFANSAGGFLMFGVDQTEDACMGPMQGLDPGPEYQLLAKDWIVGHISPLPVWDAAAVPSPDDPTRPVLVMRIEESGRPPHVVTTSGKHYIRTPSACDPIKDRATLDALYARGQSGRSLAQTRLGELVALPGDRTPRAEEWAVVIVVVPDPYVGDSAFPYLLDREWRTTARALLEPENIHPLTLLEDGILVAGGGGWEATIAEDGAIRARWVLGPSVLAGYSQTVPANWLGHLIDLLLRAQSRLQPAVRQARLLVKISSELPLSVIEDVPGYGRLPSDRRLPSVWRREAQTLTEEPHSERTRDAILRRLWRAAGVERPEPS